MNLNEISLLSDDLRPRDTPNHTLFKDFGLRPIVPDLSITEEPKGRERVPHIEHHYQQPVASDLISHVDFPSQKRPLLEECKTYSEWRKKCSQSTNVVPPANFVHDNSYDHYMRGNISGMSKRTVLDSLNSSSSQKGLDKQALNSSSDRQSNGTHKESENHGFGIKTAQGNLRRLSLNRQDVQAVASHVRRKDSCHANGEIPQHSGAPAKFTRQKSHSRSDSDGSLGHHMSNSSKHVINNHPEASNCMCCTHWPYQPTASHGCNGMPSCHAFPHGGLPSCSTITRNVGAKPGTAVARPSPKSANASQSFGGVSAHSCGDNVVYDNLYQIVLSQSEQLKSLQAQVEKLLMSQERRCGNSDSPRSRSERSKYNNHSVILMEKSTQTSDGEMKSNEDEKMSIGVMTSFVHTVAYAGRMELIDSRCKPSNQTVRNANMESRNKVHKGNSDSTSTPPASRSDSSPSSRRSDTPSPPRLRSQKKCCKCHACIGNSSVERSGGRKQVGSLDKNAKLDPLEEALGPKPPGVSAAIRAVRGCQEALATISNGCDERRLNAVEVDESITLNGVDLPAVVEQPVSPPSSIHVDVQDYHSSSSDLDESSLSDGQSSSCESDNRAKNPQTPNGWTYYQSVLGQVNQLLQDKDKDDDAADICVQDCCSGKKNSEARKERKENLKPQPAADALQVNSVLKRVAFQHEPREEDSSEQFKQLALNYLRENYPEELTSCGGLKTAGSHRRVQDMALYNVGNNMSFATFRYLERYNLLPENFKMNRMEDLPGYNGNAVQPNVENRAILTNGALGAGRSPSNKRTRNTIGAHAQHMSTGQWGGGPNNDGDFAFKERGSRTHHKERNRGAHPQINKQPSKLRHKRHSPHGNSVPTSGANGQQGGSAQTCKILDITALRQQPKLL